MTRLRQGVRSLSVLLPCAVVSLVGCSVHEAQLVPEGVRQGSDCLAVFREHVQPDVELDLVGPAGAPEARVIWLGAVGDALVMFLQTDTWSESPSAGAGACSLLLARYSRTHGWQGSKLLDARLTDSLGSPALTPDGRHLLAEIRGDAGVSTEACGLTATLIKNEHPWVTACAVWLGEELGFGLVRVRFGSMLKLAGVQTGQLNMVEIEFPSGAQSEPEHAVFSERVSPRPRTATLGNELHLLAGRPKGAWYARWVNGSWEAQKLPFARRIASDGSAVWIAGSACADGGCTFQGSFVVAKVGDVNPPVHFDFPFFRLSHGAMCHDWVGDLAADRGVVYALFRERAESHRPAESVTYAVLKDNGVIAIGRIRVPAVRSTRPLLLAHATSPFLVRWDGGVWVAWNTGGNSRGGSLSLVRIDEH